MLEILIKSIPLISQVSINSIFVPYWKKKKNTEYLSTPWTHETVLGARHYISSNPRWVPLGQLKGYNMALAFCTFSFKFLFSILQATVHRGSQIPRRSHMLHHVIRFASALQLFTLQFYFAFWKP